MGVPTAIRNPFRGVGARFASRRSQTETSRRKFFRNGGTFFREGGFCVAKKLRLRVQVHELAAWMKYEPTGAKGPWALTAVSVTSAIANAGSHARVTEPQEVP
jgi:hypothetical protein